MIRRLLDLLRPNRCPHVRIDGIYGDPINHCGGYRLRCADCWRLLDGPVSLATEPSPAAKHVERLNGLLVTEDTTPRDINEAMMLGRNVYWVPDEHAIHSEAPTPLPDTWVNVGHTREPRTHWDLWLDGTVTRLSTAPEPGEPAPEPLRLADAAVKGTPPVPQPSELEVRPAFQPTDGRDDQWPSIVVSHSVAAGIRAALLAQEEQIAGHITPNDYDGPNGARYYR